jgi:hypothetical protein
MDKIIRQLGIIKLVHIAILALMMAALLIYFLDIRKTRKEKEYDRFMVYLGQYDKIVNDRNECFKRIYYAWIETDNFRAEKLKDFNSVNYLLWRLSEGQPELAAIEDELLVLEMQCISYMNELCEIAVDNNRALEILRLKESYELFFYTTRFRTFNEFYEGQRQVLNLKVLNKKNIDDVFAGRLHQSRTNTSWLGIN